VVTIVPCPSFRLTVWSVTVAMCAVVCGATAAGAPQSTSPASDSPALLAGFWEYPRCQVVERDGTRSGSQSLFAFFEGEWGIAFTQYGDEECRRKVLTATFSGHYQSTTASARVPGATETTFRFSRKALTVYDQRLLEGLNGGACGNRRWQLGVEQDVTTTGCLWIESARACPQEYDLVRVENGRLWLGERPPARSNLCAVSRRPQRLRTVPLVRR
jgi:hypothetical protein